MCGILVLALIFVPAILPQVILQSVRIPDAYIVAQPQENETRIIQVVMERLN